MEFPVLTRALAEHFGPDSEADSPEDASEAWQSIAQERRHGGYPHLLREIDALLVRADTEIEQFLASHAPAWTFDSPEDARRGLEVFYSYLQTYGEQDI